MSCDISISWSYLENVNGGKVSAVNQWAKGDAAAAAEQDGDTPFEAA